MSQPDAPIFTRIGVFCGSSDSVDQSYLDLASATGEALAARGIELVYGGGNSGLMGAVADATMAGGGRVTGVIPGGLFSNRIDADRVTTLEVVDNMHARKARMYELSDAFMGLPGGIGTFEEVFEAATWSQIGAHVDGACKPVVLVDTNGYYDPVRQLLDRTTADNFMTPESRALVRFANSVDAAFDALAAASI